MCMEHKFFGTKERVNYIDRVGVYVSEGRRREK